MKNWVNRFIVVISLALLPAISFADKGNHHGGGNNGNGVGNGGGAGVPLNNGLSLLVVAGLIYVIIKMVTKNTALKNK